MIPPPRDPRHPEYWRRVSEARWNRLPILQLFSIPLTLGAFIIAAIEFGFWAGFAELLGTPVLLGVVHGTWRGVFRKEGREARDRARSRPGVIAKRSRYPVLVVYDAARRGDVQFLINALADPEMRGSAALRLGDLRSREAVPALLRNGQCLGIQIACRAYPRTRGAGREDR